MYADPYGRLRLAFAPIYIMEDEDGDKVNRGAVRVGVPHAIEAGSFSVTAQLNFHFVSEKTHSIYSVGFGYNFQSEPNDTPLASQAW